MKSVSAILLGAGESKRMGGNKLALPWGRETVIEHSLHTLLRSKVKEVVVVVGPYTQGIMGEAKDPRVKIVVNPQFAKGMSTSIRKGILAADRLSSGILIALGDQPFVHPRTVNGLLRAFTRGRGTLIVPVFKGHRGHPVLFHRRYIPELLALKRDVGGRSILERNSEDVFEVCTKSPGVVKDLDTREDYEKELRKKEGGLKIRGKTKKNLRCWGQTCKG